MLMSPNISTTGDANSTTVQYTENITVENDNNNNNNNDNVDSHSDSFVLNINLKDNLLLTNINPTDLTVDDLVTMDNIIYNVYQVDEK